MFWLKWKKKALEQNWYLGETFITGIGQGYIQTNPLQLCLMTAQLANGGFEIYPRITVDKNQESSESIKYKMAQIALKDKDKETQYAPIKKVEELLNIRDKKYI